MSLELDGMIEGILSGTAENPRSHGLPGKTLVHEGIQFYCIRCGSKLVENLHNRKLVYCSNAACQHNGWQLERPDLRSVYIIQKPKGDSNEQGK